MKIVLLQWGFTNSKSDVLLFFKHVGSHLILLLVYVDDILITGTSNQLIQQVINELHLCFALKTLGFVNYFLSFEAYRNGIGLFLTQTKYINDLLVETNLATSKPCPTLISAGTKLSLYVGNRFLDPTLYRSIVDISLIVNKLSQFIVAPIDVHWQACKRVLRYLKGTTSHDLVFTASPAFKLQAFCDADWASSIDDRKSTSGCCVFLGNNLITWSFKK
ncbi:hypothetical protein ACOSP7_021809 [Xanthoceras sorbifolium]